MSTQVSETIVMLENVRGSFIHGLFEPSKSETGKLSYTIKAVIKRDDTKNIQAVLQGMVTAARKKWGPQGDAQYQALAAANRICLHDGNAKPEWAGFSGNLYVGMSSPIQPRFFNEVPQEMTAAQAQVSGKFYSGAYFNMSLAIWGQDNKHGKRLNAQIRGVQQVADGEPLSSGGSIASAEEFGTVESSALATAEFGALFGTPQVPQAPQAPQAPQSQPGVPGIPF